MGIQVEWDNDTKTAIYYTVTGKWTTSDLESALETSFGLTESVDNTVHVIVDMRLSESLPDGLILYAKKVKAVLPQNRGRIVVVSDNRFVHTLLKMVKRMHPNFGKRFSLADTPSEAYRKLNLLPNTDRDSMSFDDLRDESEAPSKSRLLSLTGLAAMFR